MTRRGGSTRGNRRVTANRRGNTGGIRKTTQNRQAPHRYGQQRPDEVNRQATEETVTRESESEQTEGSGFSNSEPSNPQHPSSQPQPHSSTGYLLSEIRVFPYPHNAPAESPSRQARETISLEDMRELLQAHEDDIVNQVVERLRPTHKQPNLATASNAQQLDPQARQPGAVNPTLLRISELENELINLRAEQERASGSRPDPRELGMYNANLSHGPLAGESASGLADSVEVLFLGVERNTLTKIIENRFKPTNIHRLLASERDRAESQRTISIGGVEFEQAEREGKECEYRMSNLFKAWAVTGLFLSNENTIGPAIDLLALVLREASRDR